MEYQQKMLNTDAADFIKKQVLVFIVSILQIIQALLIIVNE